MRRVYFGFGERTVEFELKTVKNCVEISSSTAELGQPDRTRYLTRYNEVEIKTSDESTTYELARFTLLI